jgi:diguanylate cyclase (GGDEF)-like protein
MGDIIARMRATDVVARYGGEEFAIILPETETTGARTKAEVIRKAVESHPFKGSDGPGSRVTVSIGVAAFPGESADAPTLIRRADRALYQAKEAGRNRVHWIDGAPES